jgi:hypothetical protein
LTKLRTLAYLLADGSLRQGPVAILCRRAALSGEYTRCVGGETWLPVAASADRGAGIGEVAEKTFYRQPTLLTWPRDQPENPNGRQTQERFVLEFVRLNK